MSTLDANLTEFISATPALLVPTNATPRRVEQRARPLKSSSAQAYAKDLRQYTEDFGGHVPCDRAMLERYIESLRSRVTPTTIHRRLMALRREHVRLGCPSPTDDPDLRSMLRQLQLGLI